MSQPLPCVPLFRHVLLVAAAPKEMEAVMAAFGHSTIPDEWRRTDVQEGWSVVRSGVGKVNAALATQRCLAEAGEPGTLVMNVGVCGALPRGGQDGGMLPVGSVMVGAASLYADEGVDAGQRGGSSPPGSPSDEQMSAADNNDAGFSDMSALGFGYWPGLARKSGCSLINSDPAVARAIAQQIWTGGGVQVHIGRIATVSTCSGTDALAWRIAQRTGAAAEAMEGAAIGHTLMRLRGDGLGFLELRVVSNRTGDRAQQAWNLSGALEMLTRVLKTLRSEPGQPEQA